MDDFNTHLPGGNGYDMFYENEFGIGGISLDNGQPGILSTLTAMAGQEKKRTGGFMGPPTRFPGRLKRYIQSGLCR